MVITVEYNMHRFDSRPVYFDYTLIVDGKRVLVNVTRWETIENWLKDNDAEIGEKEFLSYHYCQDGTLDYVADSRTGEVIPYFG